MTSNIKTKYVNDFIRRLLDGDIYFNYDDIDLKKEAKKPVEYQNKIERWIELSQDSSKENSKEFSDLAEELFERILFFTLAGIIIKQK